MTSTPPSAQDGRLVAGRYRLLRRIGTGGMGAVWAGRDEILLRDVAVKELVPPPTIPPEQRDLLDERSMREARAAARIHSEAAITVHDVVEDDGRPWIVMELLEPRTLADVVRDDGPMPAHQVARIGLRLLDALTAAHAAGVLHRDVKPGNVLFDSAGQAVLTDFGIASLEGDSSVTMTGMLIGSPGYVAPERARGEAPTPASDLWSLGVTLYAAVEGRSPFERTEGPLATLVAVLEADIALARHAGALEPVLAGLLRRNPAERMPVEEVRQLLAEAAYAAAPQRAVSRPESPATEYLQPLPITPVGAPLPAALPPLSHPAADGSGGHTPVPRAQRGRLLILAAVLLLVAGVAAATAALTDAASNTDEAATSPRSTAAAGTAPAPGNSETAATAPASKSQSAPSSASPPAPASGTAPTPEGTASAPSTSAPAPSRPFPSAQARPGFVPYESAEYALNVPAGWQRESGRSGRTFWREPGTGRYLLVEEGGTPNGDPVRDWERQERSVSARLQDYERVSINRTEVDGADDAADWEFTYRSRNGRRHVLDRAVIDKGKAFGLYWSVPAEDWGRSRDDFEAITSSFRVKR